MNNEMLADLADVIEACLNSDDEVDRQYLLEAVVEDLRAIAVGGNPTATAELLANPVS